MRATLLGFVGGVGVASLVFFLSTTGNEYTDRTDFPIAGTPEADSGSLRVSDDSQNRQETPGQGSEDREVVATQESIATTQINASLNEARLQRELEEIQQALADVRQERDELLRDAAGVDGPVVSPISLPPEFEWLPENTNRGLFHERMQREFIDGAWASATETRLLNFVYGRPEIVQKYGAPTIRCHTTQCEVTFIAYGLNDDPSGAMADARRLFDESFEEFDGLFDCGPGECWADANSEGGVVTIFWAMTKNEQQPQSTSAATVAAAR